VTGFTATADPALTDDFQVTGVIVLDPLYPYGSRTWGPSPRPRESLTVEALGRQFVPRGNRGSLPGGGTDTSTGSGSSSIAQLVAGPRRQVRHRHALAASSVSPSLHLRRLD
jgi:hypothetical protein